ncbi:hypothetical protein OHR68_00830 [Spirillospora sp. NBC_00431]
MTEHPLPIQHAWQALADGMHVHRWFLHTAPMLRDRAEHLLSSARPEPVTGSEPPISSFLAEHLCHAGQPTPVNGSVLDHSRRPIFLCGAPVVVVLDNGDCFEDEFGMSIVRRDSFGRLGLRSETAAEITELIESAGLGYLIEVGVSVVVRTDRPRLFPPGTIAIPTRGRPLELAAELVAEAAADWLGLFTMSAPRPNLRNPAYAPGTWPNIVAEAAGSGIRLAAVQRLLEAVADDPARRSAELIRRLRENRDTADRIRSAVYAAADTLPLIASDLLVTMFPGPRRFAKYEAGSGAGQG